MVALPSVTGVNSELVAASAAGADIFKERLIVVISVLRWLIHKRTRTCVEASFRLGGDDMFEIFRDRSAKISWVSESCQIYICRFLSLLSSDLIGRVYNEVDLWDYSDKPIPDHRADIFRKVSGAL
jgi:hypothetical protein